MADLTEPSNVDEEKETAAQALVRTRQQRNNGAGLLGLANSASSVPVATREESAATPVQTGATPDTGVIDLVETQDRKEQALPDQAPALVPAGAPETAHPAAVVTVPTPAPAKPTARKAPAIKKTLFLKPEHKDVIAASADAAGLYRRVWVTDFLEAHLGDVTSYIPPFESRGPGDKEQTLPYSVELPKDLVKRLDAAAGRHADGERSRFVRHLLDKAVADPNS